jgi:hypothetical protein
MSGVALAIRPAGLPPTFRQQTTELNSSMDLNSTLVAEAKRLADW